MPNSEEAKIEWCAGCVGGWTHVQFGSDPTATNDVIGR